MIICKLSKFRLLAFFSTIIVFVFSDSLLFAHGTVIYPPSRVWTCYDENPESPDSPACIDLVDAYGTQPLYDWAEINQRMAGGNHEYFVPSGNLASGGRPDKYGGLDQVRNDWIATPVSPGPLTVIWSNSAPHPSAYYRVYITTADWTPDMELSWDKLELLVETPPGPPMSIDEIPVILPQRSGRHVLYSVWQRSDDLEAFYSASDIVFEASALPVGLRTFSGETLDKTNRLSWSTDFEANTAWHILQRSTDGLSGWEEVDRTAAAGNSNVPFDYSLIDGTPESIAYYRLLSLDFDGAEQYSNIIRLEREEETTNRLSAFPNPFADVINLRLQSAAAGGLDISVFDASGRLVTYAKQELAEGAVNFSIDLRSLSPGAYFLRTVDALGNSQLLRVVKRE